MQLKKTDIELGSLKYLLLGGENLSNSLLVAAKKYISAEIFNLYGPTETTIWSTIKNVTNDETVTIGNPIKNTQIYILGEDRKLMPKGCIGELCIGGDGLGRGYYNDAKLTSDKFIINPFNTEERIYITGDLARWNSDDNLDFLGRIDHQVKVRGYRIEPGEIESSLLSVEYINECVVTDKFVNDEKYLCAYIVLDIETQGHTVNFSDIKIFYQNHYLII